ncbi:minor capsid protein [Bacillus licheniformis]|uniref:minor capsid protein n=1 Tax=Bacillus licheniformis TaxID=1402 RepID=UPI00018C7FE2|nr:minor capsid protein [Bacillus licheniformis]MCA1183487.1 minor capsid protein [Bacillus licheniformis]MCY7740866.1 minor capsid protein [Bacillus licheniformis]MEC1351693.1 minor capsid protein [Bacillus licheniformis]MED4411017.1 minor capsid protein [Bacillus licheniformis]QDL76948.1 minor capsid protein [Bacillus licheniformis]
MRSNVQVDIGNIPDRVEEFNREAQFLLSSEVLKDSNYYAPMDTGALISSSERSSDFENGRLIWDTPYARRLYYNPQYKFSKDKNPNARGLWFEAAKAAFLPRWIMTLERLKRRSI